MITPPDTPAQADMKPAPNTSQMCYDPISDTIQFRNHTTSSIMKEFESAAWMEEFNASMARRVADDYRAVGDIARAIKAETVDAATESRILASMQSIMSQLATNHRSLLETQSQSIREALEPLLGDAFRANQSESVHHHDSIRLHFRTESGSIRRDFQVFSQQTES